MDIILKRTQGMPKYTKKVFYPSAKTSNFARYTIRIPTI